MILLLVALLGFSALCFADPVLMAHRFSGDRSRVAIPGQPPRLQVTAQTCAANTTASVDKADTPDLRDNWLCFQGQPDQCAVEAMGDLANPSFFWPTISRD
jgi:hypothetical protein